MIKQKKLAKAITYALSGTVLTLAGLTEAAAAEVYYNRYAAGTPVTSFETDGWVYGDAHWDDPNSCFAVGDCSNATNSGNPDYVTRFTGLPDGAIPFGFSGKAIVNWALQIGDNDSVTLSTVDAEQRSGIAEINMDLGRGAWQDAAAVAQGWAHNTDFGLIRLEKDAFVTFTPALTTVEGDPNVAPDPRARFGITLYKGFDTGTRYNHHLPWNKLDDAPDSYVEDNPFNTSGLIHFAYNNDISSLSPWRHVFMEAGDYTLLIGGVGGIHWSQQFEGYQLSIATSPVPVPGAVWLLGSALAGLIGVNRRKRQAV